MGVIVRLDFELFTMKLIVFSALLALACAGPPMALPEAMPRQGRSAMPEGAPAPSAEGKADPWYYYYYTYGHYYPYHYIGKRSADSEPSPNPVAAPGAAPNADPSADPKAWYYYHYGYYPYSYHYPYYHYIGKRSADSEPEPAA